MARTREQVGARGQPRQRVAEVELGGGEPAAPLDDLAPEHGDRRAAAAERGVGVAREHRCDRREAEPGPRLL